MSSSNLDSQHPSSTIIDNTDVDEANESDIDDQNGNASLVVPNSESEPNSNRSSSSRQRPSTYRFQPSVKTSRNSNSTRNAGRNATPEPKSTNGRNSNSSLRFRPSSSSGSSGTSSGSASSGSSDETSEGDSRDGPESQQPDVAGPVGSQNKNRKGKKDLDSKSPKAQTETQSRKTNKHKSNRSKPKLNKLNFNNQTNNYQYQFKSDQSGNDYEQVADQRQTQTKRQTQGLDSIIQIPQKSRATQEQDSRSFLSRQSDDHDDDSRRRSSITASSHDRHDSQSSSDSGSQSSSDDRYRPRRSNRIRGPGPVNKRGPKNANLDQSNSNNMNIFLGFCCLIVTMVFTPIFAYTLDKNIRVCGGTVVKQINSIMGWKTSDYWDNWDYDGGWRHHRKGQRNRGGPRGNNNNNHNRGNNWNTNNKGKGKGKSNNQSKPQTSDTLEIDTERLNGLKQLNIDREKVYFHGTMARGAHAMLKVFENIRQENTMRQPSEQKAVKLQMLSTSLTPSVSLMGGGVQGAKTLIIFFNPQFCDIWVGNEEDFGSPCSSGRYTNPGEWIKGVKKSQRVQYQVQYVSNKYDNLEFSRFDTFQGLGHDKHKDESPEKGILDEAIFDPLSNLRTAPHWYKQPTPDQEIIDNIHEAGKDGLETKTLVKNNELIVDCAEKSILGIHIDPELLKQLEKGKDIEDKEFMKAQAETEALKQGYDPNAQNGNYLNVIDQASDAVFGPDSPNVPNGKPKPKPKALPNSLNQNALNQGDIDSDLQLQLLLKEFGMVDEKQIQAVNAAVFHAGGKGQALTGMQKRSDFSISGEDAKDLARMIKKYPRARAVIELMGNGRRVITGFVPIKWPFGGRGGVGKGKGKFNMKGKGKNLKR